MRKSLTTNKEDVGLKKRAQTALVPYSFLHMDQTSNAQGISRTSQSQGEETHHIIEFIPTYCYHLHPKMNLVNPITQR